MFPELPYFDHFAIGVEDWQDSYQDFVSRAGGLWTHGNDAGEYSPYQLEFNCGLTLEFIAPGSTPNGFMSRFLFTRGPGPHHLTFKVASIQSCLDQLASFGIRPMGQVSGHPIWREVFIHPKAAGTGTLIQLAEVDEVALKALDGFPPPIGFPDEAPQPLGISWVGLTVHSVQMASNIFIDVLGGVTVEEGPGWKQLNWNSGRTLLIREPGILPGNSKIWADDLGVSNLVFGPVDVPCSVLEKNSFDWVKWPYNSKICTNVWEIKDKGSS